MILIKYDGEFFLNGLNIEANKLATRYLLAKKFPSVVTVVFWFLICGLAYGLFWGYLYIALLKKGLCLKQLWLPVVSLHVYLFSQKGEQNEWTA